MHAEVLRLWLTAMLRLSKLTVADEITNALAYFRLTFIAEIPRLYFAVSDDNWLRDVMGRYATPVGSFTMFAKVVD